MSPIEPVHPNIDNFFHPVNTKIKIYTKPTGIPNRMPSILSRTPPCPGKIFPVFFNDAFLFKYEKINLLIEHLMK